MQQILILNSKETKHIKEMLLRQYGYAFSEDYAYLKTVKDKLYLINKDVARINFDNLIIDKVGLYLGEVHLNEFRLSKEGAQLFALSAAKDKAQLKNVVELSAEEVKTYFQGVDLSKDLGPENRMIILQYGPDILGCAKYKEQKILNFMPKIHRGEVIL